MPLRRCISPPHEGTLVRIVLLGEDQTAEPRSGEVEWYTRGTDRMTPELPRPLHLISSVTITVCAMQRQKILFLLFEDNFYFVPLVIFIKRADNKKCSTVDNKRHILM